MIFSHHQQIAIVFFMNSTINNAGELRKFIDFSFDVSKSYLCKHLYSDQCLITKEKFYFPKTYCSCSLRTKVTLYKPFKKHKFLP